MTRSPRPLASLVVLAVFGLVTPARSEEPAQASTPVEHAAPPPPAPLVRTPPGTGGAEAGIGTQYSIGDPTDEEQLFVEFINRARADANAEALRLATTTDPKVLSAYTSFGVDLVVMQAQFATLPQVLQPLSIQSQLLAAARGHSQDQFTNGFQGHVGTDGQTVDQRVAEEGYPWNTLGENVFAKAASVFHGHAGFDVDWGAGPSGMQTPPGHRLSIHGAAWREIGIGVVLGNGPNNGGPVVVTQDFGNRAGSPAFVTGVTYFDLDGDGAYDLGEGVGGITVDATGSANFAVTAGSGGYSVPFTGTGNGAHDITFSASGMDLFMTSVVVASGLSVKLDRIVPYSPPTLVAPAQVEVGADTEIPFSPVAAATGYVLRSASLGPATFVEGAEDGGLHVTIVSGGGHEVISTEASVTGTHSFHLLNPAFTDESVTLERRIRPGAAGELKFASRLRTATSVQVARAQISTDDGGTWTDVFTQAGTGGSGDGAFVQRTIALGAYAGQVLKVRFVYDFTGGSAFTQTTATFGLYVDDIRFTDTSELTDLVDEAQDATPTATVHPLGEGSLLLSVAARNFLRQFPFGPAVVVEAIALVDTDNDGVLDVDDNCPAVSNAGQADADGDGIGDACDRVSGDTDGDGVIEAEDATRALARVLDPALTMPGDLEASDLSPGTLRCPRPGGAGSWCPDGNGTLTVADVVAILALLDSRLAVDCDLPCDK